MRVGVIVAMEQERQMLLGSAPSVVDVRVSGIGKVNAALCAADMIRTLNPDCLVNIGVAGSICADVKVGDIVIGERTAYHDVWCGEGNEMGCVQGLPRFFEASARLVALAKSCSEAGKVHSGLIVSGDQFFISAQEDRRILGLYPDALACDMESAAIAQTCFKYRVPFISLRAISDEHTSDQAQKESYDAFWKSSLEWHFRFFRSFLSLC